MCYHGDDMTHMICKESNKLVEWILMIGLACKNL